jgi:hypothetical protein
MTSRSFDHRLLLLFFPGHETHSIHCTPAEVEISVYIVLIHVPSLCHAWNASDVRATDECLPCLDGYAYIIAFSIKQDPIPTAYPRSTSYFHYPHSHTVDHTLPSSPQSA